MNQRELMFRAWDTLFKQWVVKDFHIIGEVSMFQVIEQYIEKNRGDKSWTERFNDIIITQYLNHKDLYSINLYEGDIVDSDWGYGEGGQVVEIDSFYYAKGECLISSSITIVSNIFENNKR